MKLSIRKVLPFAALGAALCAVCGARADTTTTLDGARFLGVPYSSSGWGHPLTLWNAFDLFPSTYYDNSGAFFDAGTPLGGLRGRAAHAAASRGAGCRGLLLRRGRRHLRQILRPRHLPRQRAERLHGADLVRAVRRGSGLRPLRRGARERSGLRGDSPGPCRRDGVRLEHPRLERPCRRRGGVRHVHDDAERRASDGRGRVRRDERGRHGDGRFRRDVRRWHGGGRRLRRLRHVAGRAGRGGPARRGPARAGERGAFGTPPGAALLHRRPGEERRGRGGRDLVRRGVHHGRAVRTCRRRVCGGRLRRPRDGHARAARARRRRHLLRVRHGERRLHAVDEGRHGLRRLAGRRHGRRPRRRGGRRGVLAQGGRRPSRQLPLPLLRRLGRRRLCESARLHRRRRDEAVRAVLHLSPLGGAFGDLSAFQGV